MLTQSPIDPIPSVGEHFRVDVVCAPYCCREFCAQKYVVGCGVHHRDMKVNAARMGSAAPKVEFDGRVIYPQLLGPLPLVTSAPIASAPNPH